MLVRNREISRSKQAIEDLFYYIKWGKNDVVIINMMSSVTDGVDRIYEFSNRII
jgi:hypothetical protein